MEAKQQTVRNGALALTLTGPAGEAVSGTVSAHLQRPDGYPDDLGTSCGKRILAGRADYEVSGSATIQLRLSQRVRRAIMSHGARRLRLVFGSRSASGAGATADSIRALAPP